MPEMNRTIAYAVIEMMIPALYEEGSPARAEAEQALAVLSAEPSGDRVEAALDATYDNERPGWREWVNVKFIRDRMARALAAADTVAAPINMVLHCPACGTQHVDAPDDDWTNPPHRSHLCGHCGLIWRPADVATNGVAVVQTKGSADTWSPGMELPKVAAPKSDPWADEALVEGMLHTADEDDGHGHFLQARYLRDGANRIRVLLELPLYETILVTSGPEPEFVGGLPLPETVAPKPDPDGWIKWGGGACPVSSDTLVDVSVSGSIRLGVPAGTFWWYSRHRGITAWRLAAAQPTPARPTPEIEQSPWLAVTDAIEKRVAALEERQQRALPLLRWIGAYLKGPWGPVGEAGRRGLSRVFDAAFPEEKPHG
jgi:hypothetical protein